MPADYRDRMAYPPRASVPRIAAEREQNLSRILGQHLEGIATQTKVFTINDNRRAGFRFAPAVNGQGWIEVDLPQPTSLDAGPVPLFRERDTQDCYLASIEVTDVLIIGIDPSTLPLGLTLSPTRASTRAAWYSLAFVLRAAGAKLLDVDHQELQAGIRSVRHLASDTEPVGQVFIGDSLANGAGYATYLGRDEILPDVLATARDLVREWENEQAHRCDSACYDCLRDYWNLPFHGLLDWRLAGDLLDMMIEGAFSRDRRWVDLRETSLSDLQAAFPSLEQRSFEGRVCLADNRNGKVLIPRHPLEEPSLDRLSVELADVVAAASDAGFNLDDGSIHLERSTTFDMLRRPAWVAEGVFGVH
jgi:hypothetical protein